MFLIPLRTVEEKLERWQSQSAGLLTDLSRQRELLGLWGPARGWGREWGRPSSYPGPRLRRWTLIVTSWEVTQPYTEFLVQRKINNNIITVRQVLSPSSPTMITNSRSAFNTIHLQADQSYVDVDTSDLFPEECLIHEDCGQDSFCSPPPENKLVRGRSMLSTWDILISGSSLLVKSRQSDDFIKILRVWLDTVGWAHSHVEMESASGSSSNKSLRRIWKWYKPIQVCICLQPSCLWRWSSLLCSSPPPSLCLSRRLWGRPVRQVYQGEVDLWEDKGLSGRVYCPIDVKIGQSLLTFYLPTLFFLWARISFMYFELLLSRSRSVGSVEGVNLFNVNVVHFVNTWQYKVLHINDLMASFFCSRCLPELGCGSERNEKGSETMKQWYA